MPQQCREIGFVGETPGREDMARSARRALKSGLTSAVEWLLVAGMLFFQVRSP